MGSKIQKVATKSAKTGARHSAQPNKGVGNNALSTQVLSQAEKEAPKTAKKKTEFIDMGSTGKAKHLVGLMDESKGLIKSNGMDPKTSAPIMAGLMMNESGRNGSRRMVGNSYRKKTGSLMRKMKKGGQSAADMSKVDGSKLKLSEAEQELLTTAKTGGLDLQAFGKGKGKKGSKQRAAYEQATGAITQTGIDHRVRQFDEVKALKEQKKTGKLDKKGKARLGKLGNANLREFNSIGAKKGSRGYATNSKLSDMSSDGFRGMYDEGQRRFEMHHYAKNKSSMDKYRANPAKNKKLKGKEGVSMAGAAKNHPELMKGNYDSLADFSTSWGSGQIMGAYAENDRLKYKREGETKRSSTSLEQLKSSATRYTPTQDDVGLQLGFFTDLKGMKSLSNPERVAKKYNGANVKKTNPNYIPHLKSNAAKFKKQRSLASKKSGKGAAKK